MDSIRFQLCLPPSDNMAYGKRAIKVHGKWIASQYLTKEGRAWKDFVHGIFLQEWGINAVIKKPQMVQVAVELCLTRDRDTQGSGKLLCDAMEGVIFENDSQIEAIGFRKKKSKIPQMFVDVFYDLPITKKEVKKNAKTHMEKSKKVCVERSKDTDRNNPDNPSTH